MTTVLRARYIIQEIRKNYRNPIWWRDRFLHNILFRFYESGVDILEEKWDSLIILDACRYDFFEKVYKKVKIEGRLEFRISRGAHTAEFLKRNFKDKYYPDIIYVTANPQVNKYLKGKVYKIISVWKYAWNYKIGTVLPHKIYNATRIILKSGVSKNKRLIIHFLQPHHPYIKYPNLYGTSMSIVRERILSSVYNKEKQNINVTKNLSNKHNFWSIALSDFYLKIDIKTHMLAYFSNLLYVLKYVKKLIALLPGTTVITADHGEAFGEYIHPLVPIRVYGHIEGIRIPVLVKVPWLIVDPVDKSLIKNR